MALEGGLSARSRDSHALPFGPYRSDHHPGSVVASGPVYPPEPVHRGVLAQTTGLDEAHQLLYSGFPSLTSDGEPSNGGGPPGVDCHLPHTGAGSQYATCHAGPNRGLEVHCDAVMYGIDEPPQHTAHESASSSQHVTSRCSTRSNSHMDLTYSQHSRSSSLTDQEPAWSARSHVSWQSTTIECGYAPSASHDVYEFRHQSFAPPNPGAELSSTNGNFEIVIEDPLNPQSFRERRVRSRTDVEKQREGIRLLKEFGGSCLWCYRSKKRCGPAHPCPPCVNTRRKCIRSSVQLCLLVPCTSSRTNLTMQPPSREALDILHDLGKNFFHQTETVGVGFHIRRPGHDGLETWVLDITNTDLNLSKTTQHAVDQFLEKSITYIHCLQLTSLEESYGNHPLVQIALKMALSFMSLSCLAGTQIHMHSSEVDMAKLTIFLILVAGSRNLAEMSEGFCAELCEALRRKDLHDSFNNGRYRPRVEQPQQPLNPLWVAAALYYRVVCGLLDLEASSPITKIFGSLETQLVDIRGSLWSILKYVAIDNAHNGKGTPKKTLIDQFPMLSFTRHFDLAFWLGPIIPSDEVAPPTVLKRQGDPFAEQGYDMASFLQDDVHHPSFLPSTPLPVQQVPGLTRSVQSNQRSVSDSMSLSETSNAPSTDSSLDPKDLCTILDPLEPTPWELMGSIDSIYSDFDDSE